MGSGTEGGRSEQRKWREREKGRKEKKELSVKIDRDIRE